MSQNHVCSNKVIPSRHPNLKMISKSGQYHINISDDMILTSGWHHILWPQNDISSFTSNRYQLYVHIPNDFLYHPLTFYWCHMDVNFVSFIAIISLCPAMLSIWHPFDSTFWCQENFHLETVTGHHFDILRWYHFDIQELD